MNLERNRYSDVLGQINLDDHHIRYVFEFYQAQYLKSIVAQQFVKTKCSILEENYKLANIGYCDRTMGKSIPKPRSPAGAAIRGSLLRCGLIRPTGHELFGGCVVFPQYNDKNEILSAVGYRIGRIRPGKKHVVYWHRPKPKSFIDVGIALAKELLYEQTYH